jgi:hypothetical protein
MEKNYLIQLKDQKKNEKLLKQKQAKEEQKIEEPL